MASFVAALMKSISCKKTEKEKKTLASEKEFFDKEFQHFEAMITAYTKHAGECTSPGDIHCRQTQQNDFLIEEKEELNNLIEVFSQLKFNKRFLAQLFEPTGEG